MIVCNNCGDRFDPELAFCPECGAKVPEGGLSTESSAKREDEVRRERVVKLTEPIATASDASSKAQASKAGRPDKTKTLPHPLNSQTPPTANRGRTDSASHEELVSLPGFYHSTKNLTGIFVSYRHDDSSGHAGRVFDRLCEHFGEPKIFMDVERMQAGEDFVDAIVNAVASCEILIAIIGRRWLLNAEDSSRRLDFVRLEIVTAFDRGLRVVPVLVQGAVMPQGPDLPTDLAKLPRLHAIELSDLRWRRDVDQLINALERILVEREEARRRAAEEAEERQRREVETLRVEHALGLEATLEVGKERERKDQVTTQTRIVEIRRWVNRHGKSVFSWLVALFLIVLGIFGQEFWQRWKHSQSAAIWIEVENNASQVLEGTRVKLTARTSPPENVPREFKWRPAEMIEGNGQQSVVLDTKTSNRHTEPYPVTVGLVAVDPLGNGVVVKDVVLTIVPLRQLNNPPEWEQTIHIEGSPEVKSGTLVSLNALASDKDGDNLTYTWSVENKLVQIEGNGERRVVLRLPRDFARRGSVLLTVKLSASDGLKSISDDVSLTVTPAGSVRISRPVEEMSLNSPPSSAHRQILVRLQRANQVRPQVRHSLRLRNPSQSRL